MPRYDKWLTGLSPQAPADEVARRAITLRLRAVEHYFDQATDGHHETEAIHQLRIWTRRVAVAMRFFQPAIRRGPRREMQRLLRKIRRTAGQVRDGDIQLERLQLGGREVPDRVLRALRKERREARQKVKRLQRRLIEHPVFQNAERQLIDHIAWPKKHSSRRAPPFVAWCRQRLAPIAAEFFDLATADLADFESLHALRLAGKRLRYALELTPAVMKAGALETFYNRLNEMQDRLGDVCDQRATIDRLRRGRKETSGKKQRRQPADLLHEEEAGLATLQTKLLRWWSPARQSRLAAMWHKLAR
jgi:CHAD domain-containing protein